MKFVDIIIKKLMYQFRTDVKNKHIYAFFKCNTATKFWNLIKVEHSILTGKTKNFGYPYLLAIDPINICNLRCPYCKTGKGFVGRKKQAMNFNSFKKLIGETGKYLYLVNLYGMGEPFLSKNIFNMIEYSANNNIYSSVSTNGNYDKKLNKKILSSKLDHILFSLDGSNAEIYNKYRIGGDFDKVIDNIKDLIQKRNRRNLKKPLVEVQFLVFKHNKKDIGNIKRLMKRLGVDSFLLRAANAPDNDVIRNKYYTWYQKKGFCRMLWYTAIINVDGGLKPCCMFFDKKDDIGNVFEAGFSNVWNNKLYQRLRKAVYSKKKSNLIGICKNCVKFQ